MAAAAAAAGRAFLVFFAMLEVVVAVDGRFRTDAFSGNVDAEGRFKTADAAAGRFIKPDLAGSSSPQ